MKRGRKIKSIPISAITVLNPRDRLQAPFKELVGSIARVGLKRPITVSNWNDSGHYELVCGQGRVEAFTALKANEIPAVVTDATTEECILCSLVENLARRRHSPVELVDDIGRLARQYDTAEIATKLGVSPAYVRAIRYLLQKGEQPIIKALERKAISPTLALEIARADTPELQAALLKLYTTEKHTVHQVARIRRLLEQRRRGSERGAESAVTPAALVRAYRQESDRRKVIRQRAELAQIRVLFIVSSLKELLKERMFVALLREEGLDKLPLPVLRRLSAASPEAT